MLKASLRWEMFLEIFITVYLWYHIATTINQTYQTRRDRERSDVNNIVHRTSSILVMRQAHHKLLYCPQYKLDHMHSGK